MFQILFVYLIYHNAKFSTIVNTCDLFTIYLDVKNQKQYWNKFIIETRLRLRIYIHFIRYSLLISRNLKFRCLPYYVWTSFIKSKVFFAGLLLLFLRKIYIEHMLTLLDNNTGTTYRNNNIQTTSRQSFTFDYLLMIAL